MCSWGITLGVSAIAAITSSVNSAGCGRGEPHPLQPLDLAAGPQQLAERLPVAELHAVGVDVLAQQGDLADALGDQRARPRPGCRRAGGPSPCRAGRDDAERAGVVAADARPRPRRRTPTRAGSAASTGRPRATRGSRPGPPRCTRARSSSTGSEPMLWVPKTTSTHGAFGVISPRSFCARQPPTAICMPGVRGLDRREVAEVAVELVVGVLPHRAGVEDDDVGLLVVGRGDVPRLLEQPGEPLGVVDVHLAPVGADLVGARVMTLQGTARGSASPVAATTAAATLRRTSSMSRARTARSPGRARARAARRAGGRP